MRPSVYAALLVIVALVLLATASATWVTIEVDGPVVDGVEMPATVLERAGATVAPTSVTASLVVLLAGAVFAAVGPVIRRSARQGHLLHLTAVLLGMVALALGLAASGDGHPLDGVLVGSSTPRVSASAAKPVYVLGLVGLAALLGLSWRHRRGWRARTDAPSRYTVEAVRGEARSAADQHTHDATRDDPIEDEWDLAVAEEPMAEEDQAEDHT